MKIDQHLISGTSFCRAVQEINKFLIVTVHKVNLETFDTHIRIMLHNILHITVESIKTCPQNNIHILRFGVRYDGWKIDFRDDFQQICFQVNSPTLIQNYIFDAMFGSEVDIIFISIVIDTGTEVHSVNVPIVPPVPGNLTRFDPGNITYTGRRSQAIHHIAIDQLLVIFRNDKHTPRERTVSFRFSYKIFTFLDQHLKAVMSPLLFYLRIRGMHRFQRGFICCIVQEHTRIVFQIGFGDT